MEIRSYDNNAVPKVTDRNIEGYAVVFNQESKVMIDLPKKRFFIEIIEKGAITEETLRNCDIKAVFDHDRKALLARSMRGVGSLQLSLDDYGLQYRFEAPNTTHGDFCTEMIKRGDIAGSSFAYYTDEKKNVTYERKDGILLRRVHKIDRIFDVSPVIDPAYTGTDVTVRSIDGLFQEPNNEYITELNNLRKLI